MVVDMKEIITKVRKMDRESTHGRMGVITRGDGEITKSMVLELMFGLMEDSIADSG